MRASARKRSFAVWLDVIASARHSFGTPFHVIAGARHVWHTHFHGICVAKALYLKATLARAPQSMEHVEADAEVHSNILRLTMASHKVDKVRLKLFVRDGDPD